MDQKLDRVALDFLIPAVDLTFQFAAGHYRARPRQQRLQQGELTSRQQRRLGRTTGRARGGIEIELAVAKKGRRATALAPKHRAHARQQFANLERLYQIVVRTKIEAVYTVVNA